MKSAERAHYGLAVHCARRFQGRGVEMEELISEAEAALLFAASRFDETRGVRFSTYAIPVVLGALRDLCRRSIPMHVPRGDMRILSAAAQAQERLWQAGHEPDLTALSREAGVEPGRLGQMLSAQERMRTASPLAQGDAAETCFEDALLLRDALSRLPSPMAQILWLRYGLGATQTAIAQRLGLAQPQVSRLEQKGLQILRAQLLA